MDLCTPSTPPPNDEFNNKRNCTSASPACLYGIYRDNFTCTLQQTGTIRHLWYLLLTIWFVCLVIKAILKVNTSCSCLPMVDVVAASAVTCCGSRSSSRCHDNVFTAVKSVLALPLWNVPSSWSWRQHDSLKMFLLRTCHRLPCSHRQQLLEAQNFKLLLDKLRPTELKLSIQHFQHTSPMKDSPR